MPEGADELPSAYDAMGEIERSFATHGLYRGAPRWSHPLIGAVLKQMGGCASLCRFHNSAADYSENSLPSVPPARRGEARHFRPWGCAKEHDLYSQFIHKKTRMLPWVRDGVRRLGDGDTDPPQAP